MRIAEKGFEQGLVISLERDEPRWERVVRKAVKHAARIWASIDVVTDRDRDAIADWISVEITENLIDHPVEKIRAPMDVADDIKLCPYRR